MFFEKMMGMFNKYISTVPLGESILETPEHAKYLIAGSIGNTVGVLHKWSTSGFSLAEDEVADILTNVFVTGILPYLRSENKED